MPWRNYVYDKRNLTVVICDTYMPWRNYVYDKRNLSVVICNTDMPWRNNVYEKRNMTVVICDTYVVTELCLRQTEPDGGHLWHRYAVTELWLRQTEPNGGHLWICDTDMPWRNYVVISSRSRSLVMETATFNHIFEIWWRAVHWQRKPEKSEQSFQWPWWLWSHSSSTSPYHH
jgi:hypothetical protein